MPGVFRRAWHPRKNSRRKWAPQGQASATVPVSPAVCLFFSPSPSPSAAASCQLFPAPCVASLPGATPSAKATAPASPAVLLAGSFSPAASGGANASPGPGSALFGATSPLVGAGANTSPGPASALFGAASPQVGAGAAAGPGAGALLARALNPDVSAGAAAPPPPAAALGAAWTPSPSGKAAAAYFTPSCRFFAPLVEPDAVGPEDTDVNPPYAVATYAGATSISLAISETGGDPVRVYWRNLPVEVRDRVGPRLTGGDGTLLVEGLPAGGSILFNIVRETASGRSRPYAFPATLTRADSLAGALGRKWDLVPTLPLVCGPLFSQEAPATHLGKKLQLPWTIVAYDRSEYDFTFEDIYYETTRVDLTTYTLGAQAAEDAADEISARVDWQNLPFLDPVATRVVKVEPLDFSISSTFTRHRTGQLVWHSRLSYLVTLEKRHPRWKPFTSFN